MRLIDADALCERFAEECPGDCLSCDYCCATNGQLFCSLIASTPVVDAEPVRHGRCALCKIKETGHGIIAFYGIGWQVCINKRGSDHFLVMNHDGNQTEMYIGYCPACGAKLEE